MTSPLGIASISAPITIACPAALRQGEGTGGLPLGLRRPQNALVRQEGLSDGWLLLRRTMDIAASEEHLMARNAHDLAVGVSLAQHFGCLAIMHLIEERENNAAISRIVTRCGARASISVWASSPIRSSTAAATSTASPSRSPRPKDRDPQWSGTARSAGCPAPHHPAALCQAARFTERGDRDRRSPLSCGYSNVTHTCLPSASARSAIRLAVTLPRPRSTRLTTARFTWVRSTNGPDRSPPGSLVSESKVGQLTR